MSNIPEIVKRCLSYDDEQEWFDFKDNWYELDEIGQYISALSNAAFMAGEPFVRMSQSNIIWREMSLHLSISFLMKK